jgi:hypothetical protein
VPADPKTVEDLLRESRELSKRSLEFEALAVERNRKIAERDAVKPSDK